MDAAAPTTIERTAMTALARFERLDDPAWVAELENSILQLTLPRRAGAGSRALAVQ